MSDDVIIRIRTAFEKGGIAAAEAELKKLEDAARGAAAQTSKVEGSFSSFASLVTRSDLGRTIAGYFAIRSVVDFTQAIVQAELQFQKTTRSLEFATGSATAAAEGYQFARTEAKRLGVEVGSVAEQFARFSAGAKGSSLSAKDVKTIFTGVISASRALGQSTQDTERVFLALSQTIGKGKVTAQEFRGQIGNALPEALAIGAKALGVTTTEFSRLLDAGELTIDFLPKLGKALVDTFGTTAEKASGDLQSSINRVSSSFTDLKLAIADTRAFKVGIGALGALAGAIDAVSQAIKDANDSGSPFPGLNVEGIASRKAAFDKLIADIKQREVDADAALAGGSTAQEQAPAFSPNQTKALDDASKALQEQARAANAQREALSLSNSEAVRSITIQKEIAKAVADGAPVTRGLIENAIAAADAEANLTRAQDAKAQSLRVGKKAQSEAADEAKSQANAARAFSESLTKQISVFDAQAQALARGGQAGAQYKVVQTQIAEAIAAGVPVTAALRAEIDRFADSQTRLAGINFAEALKTQTAEVNLQRDALATGGAEGARFTVVQTEINKAIAAGVEITPALRAEIEGYADSLGGLSAEQFSKGITDQTEAIKGQAAAFQSGAETSAQYAALQDQIVAQLERGIPVTDEQRQALVRLGQEEERSLIIQGLIAEAISNGIELRADLIQQIRDQADAQVNLNANRRVDQLTARAADDAAREFERQSDAITQTLTDAIFRGFENGKGFAENFKDTVKNLFSTLVLRPVIEFLVKPVAQLAQNVIGGLLNAGVSAIFGGGGGGAGIVGSLFSGAVGQGAQSLLGGMFGSAGTGSAAAAGGAQLGAQAAGQAGAQVGLTAAQASTLGAAATALSAIAGAATIAKTAYDIGGLIGAKTGSALQGAGAGAAGGAAAGAVIGSVVPIIGTAIGAIIGAIAGGVGGGTGFQTPPRGFATFSGTGVEALGGKKGLDANKSLVPLGKEIQDSIAAIDKDLSLGLIKDRIQFWIGFKAGKGKGYRTTVAGKGDVDFGDDARKLQAEIFRQEIKDATDPKKKRTEFQKRVLARGLAKETFPEQLASFDKDLKVRNRLREFTKQVEFDPAKERIKELRGELRKLTETFGSLKKEATELGLPTKRAAAAFRKTKQRTLDEILGIQIQEKSEAISTQQQAFQLAGRELPKELQEGAIKLQFDALGIAFRKLGLDTTILTQLFQEALSNLADARNRAQLQVQAQAYQLAGRDVPMWIQQAGVRAQFADLRQQFEELGLDTTVLTELLQEALENLSESNQEAAQLVAKRQGIIGAQQRAFQLAGREVPIELQRNALIIEFEALGESFRQLGLDTTILSQLLAEGLENLEETIQLARRQGIIGAQQRAFQLAGREVPMELQRIALIVEFEALGKAFRDLGLDTTVLTQLLAEGLQNLEEASVLARRQGIIGAQQRAFQLAGREVPMELQRTALIIEFEALSKAFKDLGLDTSVLTGLLSEGLANMETAARRSAIERAYQLAGEEIPKEVQIASVTADFAEIGDLFRDLGLDSGILGGLLQKAIEKINKAGEDLKSGGFIGFIDEFGRITELDPRMRDIGSAVAAAANDSQFFGRVGSPIYDRGHTPEEGGMPVGSPIMPPNVVYPPTWNRGPGTGGVPIGDLLRTPRDPNELIRRHGPIGDTLNGRGMEVNIIMNGPTVFDDISQAKFTRAVAKSLESRRARFG